MRILYLIILSFTFSNFAFGQDSEIKSKLKGIDVKLIQNNKLANYNLLEKFDDKIVIIEFWETYCAPCIDGMHHLKDLQAKFPNDLKVICVSKLDLGKTMNFINKNSFPFDFVFDENLQLSTAFPHLSIPYTIITDKKGKIQAETHPSFISETQINQLIIGESIDIPTNRKINSHETENNNNKPTLVSFELQNSELGDWPPSYVTTTFLNKKRIVTGYSANAFIDTVETIKRYECKSKNILNLYQLAFGNISELRFIFSNDLSYVKSTSPNHRYNLNFAASNLYGDFNDLFIRQLNGALGLQTEKVEIDTTVLVLKQIEINGKSIKPANSDKSGLQTFVTLDSIKVCGGDVSLDELKTLLEEKTKMPVEIDITHNLNYELNIAIKSKTNGIEEWLTLFEREGLFLVKEKRKIQFVKIKKPLF